jgi:hypothetical protein
LCTAQVGLAAMTVGDDTLADACYRWTHDLIAMQPDLPRRLYPCRIGAQLLTAADARHSAWDVVTDFHMPFTPCGWRTGSSIRSMRMDIGHRPAFWCPNPMTPTDCPRRPSTSCMSSP